MNGATRILMAFILLMLCTSISRGEDAAGIRYRVFEIPADNVSPFVRGLAPRSRLAFEELVRARPVIRTRFQSASYEAIWSEGTSLSGTCQMQRANDLVASSVRDKSARFIALNGGLGMIRPYWLSEQRRPALLGQWDDQVLVLAEENDSILGFDWDLKGQRRGDTSDFELVAPPALQNSLSIDLPLGIELVSRRAIVSVGGTSDRDRRRWTARWTGDLPLRFQIRSAEPGDRPELSSQTVSTCIVRGTGLQYNCRTTLRTIDSAEMPDFVHLNLDEGIQVTGVTDAGVPLEWSADEENRRVVISLPESNVRRHLVTLQVDAFADFARGKVFSLPRLRPHGIWTSERIRVVVEHPLEVSDVQVTGGRCASIESANGLPESLDFVIDREESQLQLRIDEKPAELQAETLLNLTLDETTVQADVETHFRLLGDQEVFRLQLEVDTTNGWLLPPDSIEVTGDSRFLGMPVSILDRVEPTTDGKRELWTIRLKQPVTSQDPVQLKFRLRNGGLRNESTLAELAPIRFPGIEEEDIWIHAIDSPGVDLLIEGAENGKWQTLDDRQGELPEWLYERLAEGIGLASRLAADDLLAKKTVGANLVRIQRRPRVALARVQSTTNIVVGENETRQTFDLLVDPIGKPMDRINVTFSRPLDNLDEPWSMDDRTERPVVRKLPPRPSDPPMWTRYELAFDSLSEPFHLKCSILTATADEMTVPLIRLDADNRERGKVAISADGAVGLDVHVDNGLIAIPFSTLDLAPPEAAKLRAAYSYDDRSTSIPTLTIRQKRLPISNVLSAWRCDVRSYYSEKGRPRHRVDYWLQNDGVDRMQVNLRAGTALEFVEIDGERILPQPRLMKGLLTIPLPREKQYPCVSIRFVEPEESLMAIDWLSPPLPKTNVPATQTVWQLWLPQDYRTYEPFSGSDDQWLSRIFGPFGSSEGPQFLKSMATALRRRLVPGTDSTSFLVEQVERMLGPDRQTGSSQLGDWGGRLQRLQQAMRVSRADVRLLVDREELRRVGISPETVLPSTRYTDSYSKMGTDRLVQAGLGLVIDANTVIVTSLTQVREFSRGRELLDGIAISGEQGWFADSRLLHIDDWNADRLLPLWRPSSDALEVGLQQGGWISYRVSIDDQQSALRVFHRDTAIALACMMFFIAFSAGTWIISRRQQYWVFALLMAAGVSLILPRPGATMAIAFAWGIVSSGISWLVFVRKNSAFRLNLPGPSMLTYTRAAVLLLLIAWPFVFAPLSYAQGSPGPTAAADSAAGETARSTPAATSESAPTTDAYVFVPVDAEGRPADVVYPQREFYSLLQVRAQKLQVRPDYLYRSVRYSADLSTDDDPATVRMTIRLKLTTFASDINVPLPDFGPNARLIGSTVRLGRQPAVLRTIDGRSTVMAGLEGDFDLEFDIVVRATRRHGWHQFAFKTPTLPDARLDLQLPRGTAICEVPSAQGSVRFDESRTFLVANLGPADELWVRLSAGSSTAANREGQAGIKQVTHLAIADNGIEVSCYFDDVGFESLRLLIDPALRPIVETIESMEWNAETRELETGILTPNQAIRFGLQRPTNAGRLIVPSIVPMDARLDSAVVSVSTSPRFSASLETGGPVPLAELPIEMVEWCNELALNADFYAAIGRGTNIIRLDQVAPSEEWDSEVAFFFDVQESRFEASSRFMTNGPQGERVTVRRFRAPAAMQIQEVAATSSSTGVPLRLRWRRLGDELVVFFLEQPIVTVDRPIDIVFRGVLETRDGLQELPLVVPVSRGMVDASQKVILYRSAGVELQADPLATVSLNMDPADSISRNGFRFYCSWSGEAPQADDEPFAFGVVQQPATRTLTGGLWCEMTHDELGWEVDMRAEVESSDGVVHLVQFEVPDSLLDIKAFDAEEALRLRIEDPRGGPGLDRRIVSVWLADGTTNGNERRIIRLKGRLTQEQTRLPRIRLLNVSMRREDGRLDHFVSLPTRSTDRDDSSIFNWRRRGLADISFDAESGVSLHRVTQADYTADLRTVESDLRSAIHLQENVVAWRTANRYVGISRFDLKPSDRSDILVKIPPNAQLMQVMGDGVPVWFREVSTPNGDDRQLFRVSLSQSPWPQRIRVIFAAEVRPQIGGLVQLQMPSLFNIRSDGTHTVIPVHAELWTLYAPDNRGVGQLESVDAKIVDEEGWNNVLLSSMDALLRNSLSTLRERGREEQVAWLSRWSERFRDVLDAARQQPEWEMGSAYQTLSDTVDNYPEVFEGDDRPQLKFHQIPLHDLWSESQLLGGNAVRYARLIPTDDRGVLARLTGPSQLPALTIRYQNQNAATLRQIGSMLLIGMAFLSLRIGRMDYVARLCLRYPHVVVALAGVAWWFLLSPDWIGLGITAAACLIGVTGLLRQKRLLLPG